jgi:hypothetical protein
MRLIKYFLIAIIFLASTGLLTAQSAYDSSRYIDDLASKLREALNLSTTQTLHVQDILQQVQEQAAASRESFIADPETIKDNATACRLASDEKIKSLLNENQKRLFDLIKDRIFENNNKPPKLDQM